MVLKWDRLGPENVIDCVDDITRLGMYSKFLYYFMANGEKHSIPSVFALLDIVSTNFTLTSLTHLLLKWQLYLSSLVAEA